MRPSIMYNVALQVLTCKYRFDAAGTVEARAEEVKSFIYANFKTFRQKKMFENEEEMAIRFAVVAFI